MLFAMLMTTFPPAATATGATVTPIHAIQGSGAISPLNGQTVTVAGIITGWDDEIGANYVRRFPEDRGLFIQEELDDADDDSATSEGIFVGYVTNVTAYPLGTRVRFTGQVKEKFGQTIIAESIGLEPKIIGASSVPLPSPITIDPLLAVAQDATTRAYYESLEGMRVRLVTGTASSGGTNKFGELFLVPGTTPERVFRTDTTPALLALDADAGAGNPSNPFEDPDGSTTEVQADLFDRVDDAIGPLAFSFNEYKIMVQPGRLPRVTHGPTAYPYTSPPAPGVSDMRVASFNLGNYLAEGSENDLSLVTAEEEAEKRTRIADAIDRLLRRPDVIAVQEVETLGLLESLADELGGYHAYLIDGNDERGINVGFLVADTVTTSNLRQRGTTTAGPNGVSCSDVTGRLFDRPPLLLDIVAPNGLAFTIVNNHFASKAAPDACREAQASFVRDRVADVEAAGKQAIVVGDLNAFEDEPALAILQDDTTTLTNLWSLAPAEERYSFAFSGRLQTLDHILVTEGLDNAIRDFRYAHINNDYYDRRTTLDGSPDGHRASDHDPPVLTLSDAPADTIAPTVTLPVERLIAGRSINSFTVPVNLSWSGTDAGGSGIDRYDLQRRAGVVWELHARSSRTTLNVALAPGNTYQYRVRAIDRAGNIGTWSVGLTFTLTPAQEDDSRVTYQGTWQHGQTSTAYGGSLRFATAAGRTATFAFTGNSIAWVSTLGPNRGIAEVRLDGAFVATVDLFAPTTLNRRIAYALHGLSDGSHSLTVRVTGTQHADATGRRVDVDGFVVSD